MATFNPQNPLVSIFGTIGINCAGSAGAGSITLYPPVFSIVNSSTPASTVSISSATFNSACAAAFTAAGGSLT